MSPVHVVVPGAVEDAARPSGGNTYDLRLCSGLEALGWSVRVHAVPGGWPHPEVDDRLALARALEVLPRGALVLLDGLVASCAPEVVVPETNRLRVVVLVHLPLGHPMAAEAGAETMAPEAGAEPAVEALHPWPVDPAEGERAVLQSATAVLTTSEWTRQWLAGRYGLRADRLHVARPGADRSQPAAGTPSGTELLCVAAVVPAKGHLALLEALASLRDLPWRLVCAGALDLAPGHVADVRRQCQLTGLVDRVSFVGPLSGDELDRAYAAADLLVLASRIETYGLVVTEALARALPVIAMSVGGVGEAMAGPPVGIGASDVAVDDSRRAGAPLPGLLVPPTAPDGLGLALRSWLEDADLRETLRAAALRRRETLSPWSSTARCVADVLAGVGA